MRIAVFAAKPYDRAFLGDANAVHGHDLAFFEARLDAATVPLAAGAPAVCVFVNDRVDAAVLERLAAGGTRLVALRCAGFNNVDLHAAARLGIAVVRVPAYSPRAVAEFTVGLLLAVERRIARGWARVRDDNFALDGLIGRNLHGRTAGVVGTGQIGAIVARILGAGFGCRVLAHDPVPDPALAACGVRYADWPTLAAEADVLTLHCPLTSATRHLIDADAIGRMREGVLIVNTGRGALIDTAALIDGLKSRRVGGVALDVYEQEADLFFEDLSSRIVRDDVFQRLLTFPNVIVTGHQAFLTAEALGEIARTTLASVAAFEAGGPLAHRIEAAAAPAAGGAERPDTPDTPDTQSPAAPAAPAAHAEPAMPAAVRDWHAHVYYDPATTRDAAARLRDEVDARFAVQIGRWHDVPVGPHTAAMYQVAFDVAEFPAFVPWLALHRAGLSVLVHPNTLAPRDDHLRHALWLGTPLPLKGDVLPETSTDAEEPPVTPNTAAARAAGR